MSVPADSVSARLLRDAPAAMSECIEGLICGQEAVQNAANARTVRREIGAGSTRYTGISGVEKHSIALL